MKPEIIAGDLLDQRVDVIVNAWNRNVLPWWLLLTTGVSAAIKRRAGTQPFRELAGMGLIPLGGAVLTSSGKLPCRALVHVAGINMLWRSSERSVADSVRSAMALVDQHNFGSVAFPLIGAGSGLGEDRALATMLEAFAPLSSPSRAVIVRYAAR